MRSAMLLAMVGLLCLTSCSSPLPLLDQIILNPAPEITLTPKDFGYDYEQASVPVADGRAVTIWYVPSPAPKAVIVVIPGAAGSKSLYTRLALPVMGGKGYDILLMDYEGYGNSPGKATLTHAADDALAVTAYAKTRHDKVVVFGISLGSPLATRAAAEYDVAALAMESSLIVADAMNHWVSSLQPWQQAFFQTIGPRIIQSQLPADYDVLTYITRVQAPKLIIHSPDDSLTPFASALEVYNAAPAPKTFWQEYDDHGMMIRLEPDVYAETLLTWLDATIGR